MSNFIIDKLPTTLLGLEIRTDFRVWMVVEQMLENPLNLVGDTITQIVNLIFKEQPPSYSVAFSEIISFANMYKEVESSSQSSEPLFDWEQDCMKVYTAFMRTYNIDLIDIPYLHVWKFKALFSDLCECTLTTHMYYRGVNLSDYDGDQRHDMARIKEKYAIK